MIWVPVSSIMCRTVSIMSGGASMSSVNVPPVSVPGPRASCRVRVDGGVFGLLRREPAWLLLKALVDDGGGAFRVGHVGAGPDSTEPFEAWTAFDLVHGPRVVRLAEHGEPRWGPAMSPAA